MHARSTARHASAQGHRPPGRASHYPSGMDMAPKSARTLPVERLASAWEPGLVPKPTPTNHRGFSYIKYGQLVHRVTAYHDDLGAGQRGREESGVGDAG